MIECVDDFKVDVVGRQPGCGDSLKGSERVLKPLFVVVVKDAVALLEYEGLRKCGTNKGYCIMEEFAARILFLCL